MEEETVALPEGSLLPMALQHLAKLHGPALWEVLLTPQGAITPGLIVFCNGQLVRQDQPNLTLASGDELKLFPMISGGL
jgi:hypothetical protein